MYARDCAFGAFAGTLHTYWKTGTDIRVIQVLLGHSQIDTTARYTAVTPQLIGATLSPLDRLDRTRTPRKEVSPPPQKKR